MQKVVKQYERLERDECFKLFFYQNFDCRMCRLLFVQSDYFRQTSVDTIILRKVFFEQLGPLALHVSQIQIIIGISLQNKYQQQVGQICVLINTIDKNLQALASLNVLYNLNQMQLSTNLSSLFKRLEGTILRLQSDELIQQMRNDSSLYACKMKYIQQLIQEEMNSCVQLEESLLICENLQEKLREREICIERMKNEYAVQLENIEHHCRELIHQNDKKLKEKDENLHKVRYEVSSLQATLSRSENNNKSLKEELAKMKQENTNLRQEKLQLQKIRSNLQSQIQQLQRESTERNRSSEGALKETFQQRMNHVVAEYEQTIQQMQKDMGFIKQSWEKACIDLENQHHEEMTLKLIESEQKFKKQFAQYAENLKMGSSVVFSDSEQVIGKKVELIERKYQTEMTKLSEEIKQLQQEMADVRHQIEEKEETIAQLTQNFKEKDAQVQKTTKILQLEIQSKQRETSALHRDMKKLQAQLSAYQKQIKLKQIQTNTLNQQVSLINKKYNHMNIQFSQQEKQMQQLNKTIASQTVKITDYKNQISNYKQQIMHQEKTINANSIQLQNQINNIQKMRITMQALEVSIEQWKRKQRKERQKRKKIQQKLDRLHIIIRKVCKQSQMLKQQVACSVQMLNNKLTTQSSLLIDNLIQRNDSIIRKHKTQMSQLLDQMEQKQKELIENLANQKNQMKLDIKQYDQVIKQRDADIYRLKQYINGLEQDKKELLIDLQSQKLQVIHLEERLQTSQQNYVNQITKAQKEISRCLSGFNSHWSEQINKLIQQMEVKDARIKFLSDSIDQMNADSQQSKRQRTWMEDQIRKYKKKYENFKQERDEKVEALLKKLQQEAKHRINLQKQLKQVRMSVMKGTYHTSNNNNFSFNDKERQSSNKPFTTLTKQDHDRQRQRDLSQIREMIAKTYKVVDGPAERDIGRNISKKTLF